MRGRGSGSGKSVTGRRGPLLPGAHPARALKAVFLPAELATMIPPVPPAVLIAPSLGATVGATCGLVNVNVRVDNTGLADLRRPSGVRG